jgi:hypothetical protein
MATGRVSGGRRSGGIAGGTRMNTTKNTSKGKAKVVRRVENINETADARTGGAFGYNYKKGKLTEVIEGAGTSKVKPRNLGKVLKKMAPSSKQTAKKYAKRDKSTGPFGVKPVPVKKKAK